MSEKAMPSRKRPVGSSAERPVNLSESTEDALRMEIRETQAAGADLVKWKLLAVAVVGAFSLGATFSIPGFYKPIQSKQELGQPLLCLIPLICMYTDLVCLHYTLRIITIGGFIRASYEEMRRKTQVPLLDYEGFVFALRGRGSAANPFSLELVATVGSTITIDSLLLLIAILALGGDSASIVGKISLVFFPSAGLAAAWAMNRAYGRRLENILEGSILLKEANKGDA